MSAYRDDVAALAARQQALAAEVADKTRQLEATTQTLEEARARARLPILDNIRVASPCPADWEQMRGDDRVRACDQCQKNVYNLSELTREEAEALLIKTNGDLCGRYYQRKDGTILLKDCEIGVARNRKRKVIAAGAAALLGGAAGLFSLAHRSKDEAIAAEHTSVGGRVIIEPDEEPVEPVEAPPPPRPDETVATDRDDGRDDGGDDGALLMINGFIATTPADEEVHLQRQLDMLHQQQEELSARIRETEEARARLRQAQPSRPLTLLKVHEAPPQQAPAEPTLEELWNEEK